MLDGIDVSVWQGNVNWSAVAASGIAFAIAKSSEGTGFTDPRWAQNQAGLLAPGPLVGGSYHFSRADLGNSPQAEADWYLSRHDAQVFAPGTPWIFSLDAEAAGHSASWCYQFLDRVSSRVGYSSWFYSYTSWISARGVQAFNRPLWIAAPSAGRGSPPAMGWPAVTAHQYGVRGVPGIGGEVDANDFLGDRTALLKLAGIGSSQPPAALKRRAMSIVVARNIDDPADAQGKGAIYVTDGLYKRHLAHTEEAAYWAGVLNPEGKMISVPGEYIDRVEEERGVPMNQSEAAFDLSEMSQKLEQILARLPKQ